MATTTKGWPYPVTTDTPDVPRDIKAVADTLDAKLPYAISAQTVTVSLTAASSGSATVTWPTGRFSQTPIVSSCKVGTLGAATALVEMITANSATGCTVSVYDVNSSTVTASVTIHLIAVQYGVSSAAG